MPIPDRNPTRRYGAPKACGDTCDRQGLAAGGPTKSADEGSIYVLRADGSVKSKRQIGFFTASLERSYLMPGDSIVVPEELIKLSWTKELKDWSQIFYQFALGVAGLKVLKSL